MPVHDVARGPAGAGVPLTALQQGMLFQALVAPDGGFDVEQVLVRLDEPVDARALAAAWRVVGARHDALRVSFTWAGLAQPLQRFDEAVEPEVVEHDWRGADLDAGGARLAELVERDRRSPFDLTRPPWRVHLVHLARARTVMLWTIHHLVIDGRSFARVLDDVMEAHAALCAGRAPTLATAGPALEAIVRARSARPPPDDDGGHWRALLAGSCVPTPLPFAAPASTPLRDRGTGAVALELDAGTTAGLHALTVSTGAKMSDAVHALWALLLSRWSGERDVVFGSTRSTRRGPPREDAPTVVGMFITTLPMRVSLEDDRSVRDLLGELRRQVHSQRGRHMTSLVDIARYAGLRGGVPLFETLVMFDVADLSDHLRRINDAWQRRIVELHERPSLPLVLTAFDGPRLRLRLLFERGRVRQAVAERVLRHFACLARAMARGGEQRLGDLEVLPDDERETILWSWNATERAFPDGLLLHQGFEERAARQPEALAVVQGGRALDFRTLEEQANRLAHLLRQRGAAPGTFVAVFLERTPTLVVALLAIAKSGAAYVPIDPAYPPARIAFMLTDSGAALVVTERALRDRLGTCACLVVDGEDHAAIASMPVTRPDPLGAPDDSCYAIYTSGSTGRPKGVLMSHRAVVNTLDWVTRTFAIGPRDRLLFVTSPCFDLSVYDTFGVLAAGAAVEVASATELRDPALLAQKLVRGDVTIWDSAPQALARLLPHLPERAVGAGLRLVLLSGDWIPLSLPPALQRVFPNVAVNSLGGATEAAIWSNWFPVKAVDPRWASVPYGRPIQNARYHVLDHRMRPVPPGVPGELYIGGACLARGYLNRPELTAERFVADPFREREPDGRPARLYKTGDLARYFDDGNLELLGRADLQVKVRGFRVELGEIEAVLRQQPQVADAVCVARRDASSEVSVWAYVTLAHRSGRPGEPAALDEGGELDRDAAPEALRRALARGLPDFMMPAGIVVLDQLPLSANGKIDRDALPSPTSARGARAVTAPRTALEARVVDIWRELLRQDVVGVDDDFFALGGHSLLAVHLIARLKRDLAVEVPLSRVLERPTVAALAEYLEAARSAAASGRVGGPGGRLISLHADSDKPPLFLVAGIGGHVFTFRELAVALGPDQAVLAFTAIGADGEQAPKQRVGDIAAAYQAEIEARGTRGPVFVGGYSFGALVAFELAHRLRGRGVDVRGIVAFDAYAPGYPQRLPPVARAVAHLRELVKRDLRGRAAYLAERADNVRRRALVHLGLEHRLAPKVGGDAGLERRMQAVWAASMRARGAYLPGYTDPGPLLLILAGEPYRWPAMSAPDATHGWRSYVTGRIDVLTVPGSHLELFAADHVPLMARELRRFMAAGP